MFLDMMIVLYYWAMTLFSFMPNWQIPDSFISTFQAILGYVVAFNGLFPVIIALKVIGVIISFEMALWLTRIVISAFNFMRGGGGINI